MPEFPTSYGLSTPGSQIVDFVTSWWADDAMYAAAIAGIGIGREAYDQIPSRMSRPPKDQMEAYEQASYYVALAARRAAELGDDQTKRYLQVQLNQMAKEGRIAKDGTNLFCSLTGYGCPVRGASRVLKDTIRVIEDSALPDEERVRMTTILRASLRFARLREAVPWLVLLGVGASVGAYYWHSQKKT